MKIMIILIIILINILTNNTSKIYKLFNPICLYEDIYIENKKLLNYNYKLSPISVTNIQALQIIGILEKFRPNNICEFGTGVTTDIFDFYCEKYNKNILTIEHNIKYKRKHSKIFKLIIKGNVTINNIEYKDTNFYNGLENFFKSYHKKFDFILIDAPAGENNKYKYARIQMIDFIIYDLLDNEGYFLIHNVEKKCIENSVNILLSLFKTKNYNIKIEYLGYKKQKTLAIIEFKKKLIKLNK